MIFHFYFKPSTEWAFQNILTTILPLAEIHPGLRNGLSIWGKEDNGGQVRFQKGKEDEHDRGGTGEAEERVFEADG